MELWLGLENGYIGGVTYIGAWTVLQDVGR